MYRSALASTLLLLFSLSSAEAKDLCEQYRNYAPLPDWYNEVCNQNKSIRSVLGGAYSTFADAFNLNPAAIPTVSIPWGAEEIFSTQSGGSRRNNIALIKGFQNVGAALSSNSDESFYGSSVFRAPGSANINPPTNSSSGPIPTFNLGTAVSFKDLFPESFIDPSLGVMTKYNKASRKFTLATGFALAIGGFTAGLSYSKDPATAYTPEVKYGTGTLGFKFSGFQLEAISIISSTPVTVITPTGTSTMTVSSAASIFSASFNAFGFLVTAAARTYKDAAQTRRTQSHFAIQHQITESIALGFMANYIPGYQSLDLQVLF